MSKKLFHRKNDSGELDVFEAANYFAGANNDHQVSNCHNKIFREVCNNNHAWRSGRMSLEMPMAIQLSSTPFGKSSHQMEKPAAAIKGKCKQPSSPGGKLASFLNSIFNQKNSSKKKKKSKSGAVNEDAQSPGGWIRRRRSSLSELYQKSSSKTTSYYNNNNNNNVATSNNSGFRTPPPNPKKSCQDKINYHKAAENMIKFDDDYDGGAESDSSSDLFDLPNRELLDYYSSGLPVYQTTKSCAQISATVI